MEFLKVFFAKSLVWVIVAFLLSFPLALIPLTIINQMVAGEKYSGFIDRIDNQIIVLYLILAFSCFIGMLLVSIVAYAVSILFQENAS